MPVWIFMEKEDESNVSHLEIVEIKTMILMALTLLVFEVVSDGATDDNINFFCLYPLLNSRHISD